MSCELVAAALAQHEEIIDRGLHSFIEVGEAFLAIRDQRLYRESFATFDDYTRDRWGITDSRARQLMIAAQTVTTVTTDGLPAPANEAQARELARVPEPEREQVWAETLERTGGKPTAAAVREVAYADLAEEIGLADLVAEAQQKIDGAFVSRGLEPPADAAAVVTWPDGSEGIPNPTTRTRREATPDEIEDDRQRRYTASLGDVLVSVWALLDPDPGVAVKRSWRREHSVHVDLPLQADRFTTDGIRHTADLLSALADHVEQNGGAL